MLRAPRAGITIGKAHPYLVSFCKVGFVVQDDAGSYEIGPSPCSWAWCACSAWTL